MAHSRRAGTLFAPATGPNQSRERTAIMAAKANTKSDQKRKACACHQFDIGSAINTVREILDGYKEFLRSRYPLMRHDPKWPNIESESAHFFARRLGFVRQDIDEQIRNDHLPTEAPDFEYYWVRPMVDGAKWVLAAKIGERWDIALSWPSRIHQRQDENGELWDHVGWGISRFQYEIGPRVEPPA